MKRLLSTGCMLFLMFLLLLFYAAAAETDAALSPDTLSATVNTQTIRAAVKDETVCFFLPSNADLHNITLQFPETEGVTYRIRPSNAELHSGAAILPRIISAGSAQSGSSLCPYCHKEHKGVWGKIVAFFHKIFYRLKNLF